MDRSWVVSRGAVQRAGVSRKAMTAQTAIVEKPIVQGFEHRSSRKKRTGALPAHRRYGPVRTYTKCHFSHAGHALTPWTQQLLRNFDNLPDAGLPRFQTGVAVCGKPCRDCPTDPALARARLLLPVNPTPAGTRASLHPLAGLRRQRNDPCVRVYLANIATQKSMSKSTCRAD